MLNVGQALLAVEFTLFFCAHIISLKLTFPKWQAV